MAHNQTVQNQGKLQNLSMYMWRTNRRENEKRAENVNREILRRQHTN
jgi:uncharacterized protein with FMN-binding domain